MTIQSGAQENQQVRSTASAAEQLPLRLGVYEHFTGNRYQVDGFGHLVFGDGEQENVGEQVVVYHALFDSPRYGEQAVWIRPVDNFTEEIAVDGRTVQRFRHVDEHSPGSDA